MLRILPPLVLSLTLLTTAADDPPATGKTHPDLASLDKMMLDFLPKHNVPGAALAVGRHGQVVYARGFGYANKDKKEPVQPDSLFRIASVSKSLTGVAIVQLIERGKLKLDDRVFELLALTPPTEKDSSFDERWKKVTIRQLLHHTGGWDREKSFDPMFISPRIVKTFDIPAPAMPDAIIRYMLRQPLDFEPGERFAYSNFGYCLLGRVIEKASGVGYEEYVRKEVLKPLGIQTMKLGHTLLEERAAEEVHYYAPGMGRAVLGPTLGKRVPVQYGGWCLEALDAHGGWIASAPDLVRFALAVNAPDHHTILNKKSVEMLFARPAGKAGLDQNGKPATSYYGCGWNVVLVGRRQRSVFHDGSIDGTSSLMVHRYDGLAWAVLFNSREKTNKQEPAEAIDALVHEAVDAVKRWP